MRHRGAAHLLICAIVATSIFTALQATKSVVAPIGEAVAAPIAPHYPPPRDWQTLTHDTLGFKLSYPGNVFQPSMTRKSDVGSVFVSPNGLAKLVIAAFDNEAQARCPIIASMCWKRSTPVPVLIMRLFAAAGSSSRAPATTRSSMSAYHSPATGGASPVWQCSTRTLSATTTIVSSKRSRERSPQPRG